MDSELQFDDIYRILKQARLLDEDLIMGIEAYKYGLADKKTQIGYGKLRRRCNSVSEITGIEFSDGTYQRRLKDASDPDVPIENKSFSKDKKNGKYNINFLFIEKAVEQKSKGLVRILPPGAWMGSDHVSFEVRDSKGKIKKTGKSNPYLKNSRKNPSIKVKITEPKTSISNHVSFQVRNAKGKIKKTG